MFEVIYTLENLSISSINLDLRSNVILFDSHEVSNTFKSQIELQLRNELGLSEDNFLEILTIKYL